MTIWCDGEVERAMGVGMASQFVGRWHAISLLLTCAHHPAYLLRTHSLHVVYMNDSTRCINAASRCHPVYVQSFYRMHRSITEAPMLCHTVNMSLTYCMLAWAVLSLHSPGSAVLQIFVIGIFHQLFAAIIRKPFSD